MLELENGLGREVGIVVIGRNEGSRLVACLQSLKNITLPIIYVDSDSSDNSMEVAKNYGIQSFSLPSHPFLNAARARNAGCKLLIEKYPQLQFIQFVDGDTALEPDWLQSGFNYLHHNSDVAIVEGMLREKDKNSSIYKRFFALEWLHPKGFIAGCGGNFMIRKEALIEIHGFNEEIIGGEDSELCFRLRNQGWQIFNLGIPMGIHDSGISSLLPLMKRMRRAGYCFQQISCLHEDQSERLFYKENISNWIYGGLIPLLICFLAVTKGPWSFLLLAVYPFLFLKIYLHLSKEWSFSDRVIYSVFCVLSKFPGFLGACDYLTHCAIKGPSPVPSR